MATNINLVTDNDVTQVQTATGGTKIAKVGATDIYAPTIPTIPTVASTSSLLKGDGAGNAVAASASDLPLATGSVKGAVNPTTKTTAMTQAVGVDPTSGALYTTPASGGVTQIVAGSNITISPSSGTGAVTINASGGGGGASYGHVVEIYSDGEFDIPVWNGFVNINGFVVTQGDDSGKHNFVLVSKTTDSQTKTIAMPNAVFAGVTTISFAIGMSGYDQSITIYDSAGTHVYDSTSTQSYTLPSDARIKIDFKCCLSDSANIKTNDGDKRISKLSAGDCVVCLDENGNLTTDTVTYCDSNEKKYGDVRDDWTLADGTVISTVHPHEFYNATKKRFMYIADFEIGDLFRKFDGTTSALVKHDEVHEKTRHFTLFTEKYNNYFANGILTGNRHSVKFTKEI